MDHWQNTEQREDKYGDHGGDHQQYLQQKRRKLDDQRRRTEGNWFAGCVVWIDGLTDPPADELEQLVVAGGGLVCDSRDRRATHIVAVNMTAAQTKKLKARKRGFAKPAVTPQWVVDCAARRCKQDPGPYLLWRASGPTDEALAVVRARNNLRKAGFGSEVVEEVVDDASSVSSVEESSGRRICARAVFIGTRRILGRGRARRRHVPWKADPREPRHRFITIGARVRARRAVAAGGRGGVHALARGARHGAPAVAEVRALLFDLVSFCFWSRTRRALAGAVLRAGRTPSQ